LDEIFNLPKFRAAEDRYYVLTNLRITFIKLLDALRRDIYGRIKIVNISRVFNRLLIWVKLSQASCSSVRVFISMAEQLIFRGIC